MYTRIAVLLMLTSFTPCLAAELISSDENEEAARYTAPMAFSREPDGTILAMGTIQHNTADAFRRFLDREHVRPGEILRLASLGGHNGIPLGRVITEHGLVTQLGDPYRPDHPVYCSSACTIAFIGGVHRLVAGTPIFQVHAPEPVLPNGSSYGPDQRMFTITSLGYFARYFADDLRYARERGVDPEFIATSYATPNADAQQIDTDTLVRWRIVTFPAPPPAVQQELMRVDPLRRELCGPALP